MPRVLGGRNIWLAVQGNLDIRIAVEVAHHAFDAAYNALSTARKNNADDYSVQYQ